MINNDKSPLVSIIMPAYNSEVYLESAICSILGQTYQNWELFILDDGSSDLTLKIAEKYCRIDNRVKLIKNACNLGVAETRNRGLDLCQGDYIAFLDSDDRWYPNKLVVQIQHMQESQADISYTSYAIIDEQGIACRRNFIVPVRCSFDKLLGSNVFGCSTVILTRAIAEKYRFSTDFYHEDYCLWLDILRDGYRAVGCPEVLAEWRLIMNSRSYNKLRSAKNKWHIYRKYLHLSLPKSMISFLKYAFWGIKKYCMITM